jgi:hypothetical protein
MNKGRLMPASTQFVYWSRTIGDGYPSETDLRDILSEARVRNERDGITGALLSGDGWFAQVLEGSPEAVHSLIESINRDARHHDMVALPESAVTERTFPDWAMGFAMSGESEQLQQIHRLAREQHDQAAAVATLGLIQESIAKFQLW